MQAKKWARVKDTGAHGLRRGAWFLVVNDTLPSLVVLDVRRHNVPVPRSQVDLSDAHPTKWSVVQWKHGQRGLQRVSEVNFGLIYAVCPECSNRQQFDPPDTKRMRCAECGGDFEIDWDNPC